MLKSMINPCLSRFFGNLSGKEKKLLSKTTILVAILLVSTMPLWANHIEVGTVTLTDQNTTSDYTHIQFDISWENSWRVSTGPSNWDAAWVFAKWKLHSDSTWAHCTLSSADGDHTAPTGSTIDAATDSMGVFIYRSSDGSGSNNWDGTKLRWNYGTDGVADDATVDVKVFAIEMVYIPQGSFSLFSGESGDLTSNFNSGNTISSEDALSEGDITWDRSESDWCGAQNSDGTIGGCAALGADYPKGYKAIYCMKYEISQGQYSDFLNTLTSTQDGNRYYSSTSYRYTIGGSAGSRSASVPNRACNYLQWADGLAYADWAGLRPMTELEYEKICRGPEAADIDYAWGSTSITQATTITNDGQYNSTVNGNCCYGNHASIQGPLRCGIFATGSSTRETSGATYYGVMEMSGNLWERCITVAKYCYDGTDFSHATGAGSFDGQNGDGTLSGTGFADVTNWPSPTVTSGYTAYGSSFRGASWNCGTTNLRVSARSNGAYPLAYRNSTCGFRAVRTP